MKHSLFLYYDLLIIILFSIQTTINLLLPHPVFVYIYILRLFLVFIYFGNHYEKILDRLLGRNGEKTKTKCFV